ncbi:autotransporter assembly complex protein TamA [Mycetohabitans sp. B4]|nr:autotransporter assembly complex protein TamA [Mycetohabitans sp. B4]
MPRSSSGLPCGVARRARAIYTRVHAVRWALQCAIMVMPLMTPGAALAKYDVDIDAPSYALRKLLRAHLDVSRFAKRNDISDEQFEFLVTAVPQQVRDLLSTEGYFEPVVRTDVRADKRRAVTVHVEPGPRTHVSAVELSFTGPMLTEAPEKEKAVRSAFGLTSGEPFTQTAWDEAKKASLKTLQSHRYLGATIARSQARINPRTHEASLSITYESGPTFTIGPLDVSGTRRYPQSIITNVNPLGPGEIYSAERIAELQRQVQNTPYYASVGISVDDDVRQPQNTPVHVKVSEYQYNAVRTGIGYSSDTGGHIQGAYSYLDMFGVAWPFSFSGRLDQTQQYGQVQLSMPPGPRAWTNTLLGSYTRTDVSGTDIHSARVGAQRTRTSQNIDYNYQVLFYLDRLDQNSAGPTVSRALVPAWLWTRRNVDDPVFPRAGNLLRLEAGLAIKGVMTDQTFGRAYANARQYVPIGRRDIVLLRLQAGGVFTTGGSRGIPASLLFRAGGTETIRGYGYDSIGNNVGGSVLPTKYLLSGAAEYQHWFNHDWGAAAFWDIGTATDNWTEKFFYQGVGVGARWRSPVGPINVDLAYGLRNHSWRPYLTLGIAF